MKLRNKKTGKVVEAYKEEPIDLFIYLGTDEEGDELDRKTYRSLAELNEEWEDYKPTEPLIKDEKIRKAVRAWAEVNDLKNVALEHYDDENIYFIDRDREPQLWFPKKCILESPLDDGKIYTIAELCGEENDEA